MTWMWLKESEIATGFAFLWLIQHCKECTVCKVRGFVHRKAGHIVVSIYSSCSIQTGLHL